MFAAENCVCSYFRCFHFERVDTFSISFRVACDRERCNDAALCIRRTVDNDDDVDDAMTRFICQTDHQINNKNIILIFCPCGHGTMHESVTSRMGDEMRGKKREAKYPEILRRCNVRRLLNKLRVTSFHAARASGKYLKCTRRREVVFFFSLFLFSSISIWKHACEKCQKIYWILFEYLTFASCVSI